MYIDNAIKNVFFNIKNIINEKINVNSGLNTVILKCYNTIVSFIKNSVNKNIDFTTLQSKILSVNNNYKKEVDVNEINKKEEVIKPEIDYTKKIAISHNVKNIIFNDFIEQLFSMENKNLKDECINTFKDKLILNTKQIEVLEKNDNENIAKLANAIIDTIKKSENEIKNMFGDLDNNFLFENIKFDIKENIKKCY